MPGCEPGGKGSTPFGYPCAAKPRSTNDQAPMTKQWSVIGHWNLVIGHFSHECAPGRAGSLQNCSTGFDSSRSCSCPDGVAECIGPSEATNRIHAVGARVLVQIQVGVLRQMTNDEAPMTNPDAGHWSFGHWSFWSSGCAGLACNSAKVEVQVRFLARTLDAGARRYGGCLQSSLEWVRLPPASLGSKRG
jgi:hypothetical protein